MKTNARSVFQKNFEEHFLLARELEKSIPSLVRAAEKTIECLQQNRVLWLCGNGGSAADCEHIAAEFINRYKKKRNPFPAVSLVSNISNLTAIANDYSFDLVFSKQLDALSKKGDRLWVFSTSGKSKNILEALKTARKKNVFSVLFTGNQSGPAADLADLVVIAPSSDTPRIQEMHQLFYHAICEIVEKELSENP
ncbi:SIS domain-containing protein [Candidatus Micrarchaeota archaeon]|nr:SIS domain-containing protein [Candidatus Micrarchaeota archaeon]MBU1930519.1 SIS domain-containing protein [Candidatus Micrarchaeota archaeon]